MVTSSINEATEREKYRICYTHEGYGQIGHISEFRKLQMRGLLDSTGTLIDIGCGRGSTLIWLKENFPAIQGRGTVFGEPGDPRFETMYAHLPSLEGVPVHDFVTCYEVIEHLPVQDVLPSIDRLLEITNKVLFFSCNDRCARALHHTQYKSLVLHMSRFPLKWWLDRVDSIARKIDAKPHFLQRQPAKKHNWYFSIDKREKFSPIDRSKIDWSGYKGLDSDFWFWYVPEFPLDEIPSTPSRPEVLADPAVQALWRDLDARGIQSPILLHNIPGQPHRRYWTRCGNHRRHWAEARGLKTIPAIVYGGCEYDGGPYEKGLTREAANTFLADGHIVLDGNNPPDVAGVGNWQAGEYPRGGQRR